MRHDLKAAAGDGVSGKDRFRGTEPGSYPRLSRRPGAARRGAWSAGGFICPGLVVVICFCGCVSRPADPAAPLAALTPQSAEPIRRAQRLAERLYPAKYRAIQRAILTVGRRQFTCDGVLTASPGEGRHLALVSSLGVVTDLRVKNDGACQILKVTPLFRESWGRQFVAPDLRWLFGPTAPLEPAGLRADGRLVLQSRPAADGTVARYVFSADGGQWEALEVGRNGRWDYHCTVRRRQVVAGHPSPVPWEFEVQAATYRLHLRMAAMTVL
jgi:hypothetical protein